MSFTIRPNETDDYLEFEVDNIAISMANAIRRIALAEVETYAVSETDVKLQENTSPLHNEYISHRISLLPLNQTISNLDQYRFYISKKHTKDVAIDNDQNSILEITTDDVQVYDIKSDSWVDTKDIFTDTILITKLNVKQKLLGYFSASKGKALEHARWQSVSTICYRYKVQKDLTGIEYDKVTLEEERDWIKKGNGDPTGFIFYLETDGIMPPREVITKSLFIIKNKVNSFKEYIKSESTKLEWTSSSMLSVEYEGEMHTLGNLLATMGLEMLGENDYIGYRIIHPMMNKFILRIKLEGVDSREEHVKRLYTICDNIEKQVDGLISSWTSLH
jgi:DNA-directed RNA polymerase II subunit RPB3